MLNRQFIRIAPFAALIAATLFLSGCGVNTIPTYEQEAKAKWSEIQNQYKRRADLIPNLVESVHGFADQEKSVLDGRHRGARQGHAGADQPAARYSHQSRGDEEVRRGAERSSRARSGSCSPSPRRYPDIKSGQNFLALQSQIEGTENRIAIARRDYIEAVQKYNTELNTFPGRIWKSVLYSNAKDMATFDIAPAETQTPKVDFGPRKS